jgi:hypothetical protein
VGDAEHGSTRIAAAFFVLLHCIDRSSLAHAKLQASKEFLQWLMVLTFTMTCLS